MLCCVDKSTAYKEEDATAIMMKIPDGYLSRQQAAKLLGVHPRTIDRYADMGQLPKHTQNYRVYFKRDDVEKLAQVQPVETVAK